jgi:16S rRNA (uracil1498-N3)-methyltransferase
MSERFYIAGPLHPGPVALSGPEAHHLATVSRLRAGDRLCLFNGDGREYPAQVVSAARRAVELEVLGVEAPAREPPLAVTVAAPVPKGDRAQFLIEKLTETGVTTFVPLACQRSIVHPREGKRDKFERYVIEASKQCGRNLLMQIADVTAWEEHAREEKPGELRLIAHPATTGEMASLGRLAERVKAANTGGVRIAVGPEGGFTDAEVDLARAHGWQPVDLGPRILRVETAAVVLAAHVIFCASATAPLHPGS